MMKLPGLDFVYEGGLLSFRGPVHIGRWKLIDDLEAATKECWAGHIADNVSWNDIRQNAAMACDIHWPITLAAQVCTLAFAFTPWYLEPLEDDVGTDLGFCISHLNAQANEPLFVMVLEAYAAGGWPCGWSGQYPDGKLCVYWQAELAEPPTPSSAHEKRLAYQKKKCREQILMGGPTEYGPSYTRRSSWLSH